MTIQLYACIMTSLAFIVFLFHRGPHAIATFSFAAEGPGELSIAEGDQVELIERVDAAWMKGRLGGKEGIFPAEFVKVIVELPPKDARPSKPATKGTVIARFSCVILQLVSCAPLLTSALHVNVCRSAQHSGVRFCGAGRRALIQGMYKSCVCRRCMMSLVYVWLRR